MDVADFSFDLPDELIAQEPPAERGASRLLVLAREASHGTAAPGTGRVIEHTTFMRLPELLREGDLLVMNDSRVFPARLLGTRVPSGGAVECLLVQRLDPDSDRQPDASALSGESRWEALVHPGQKLKPGARVVFEGEGVRLHGEIEGRHFHGRRTIRLWTDDGGSAMTAIERIGHMPLPPYIRRADEPRDRERYQTVYARERGSIAAPTAGLHVTRALLEALAARGVERTTVTLHVGYGTFKPVRTDRVEDHVVDAERFSVPRSAADALTRARADRRRIIAVGTTTVRVLETLAVHENGRIDAASGWTNLFVHPGHRFTLVEGLITNFHLPRSSLLMLVCAFGGRERVLAAYEEAVKRRYRFYSYGDAMLIL